MAKVALLIGVSEYEVGLNPLPAAVKDVLALERILKDSEMGDFDEVKTLTNPEPQKMQDAIETLFSDRSRDDLVLLFFSGHGIKDESNNLYFATRITKKLPNGNLKKSTAVSAKFIHDEMNGSRAKRQAIILDCCFSGAFDPSLQSKDDGSVDLKGQLGAEGRVVMTSSSSTQYSFEQQGSDLSLYTRYLVEGIETGAGDRDEDGKISVRELHDYAVSKVKETAPNMTPKLIVIKEFTGLDIVLAKAKVTDPKLRYRREVEQQYSTRGAISSIGRTILDRLQIQLGLSAQVAKAIETEVLRPYQERLDNIKLYQVEFSKAVKHEYPLSSHDVSDLEKLLDFLRLRREDVNAIEQEIITQSAQSSAATREEYQQKLQRYEQDFRRAVEAEYPLNTYVRQGLNNFQQSLGLSSEDVDQIERPILAQKHQQKLEAEELKQKQEQEKLKQEQEKLEYQRNLLRYEQEFRRSLESGYPFSDYVRNGLRDFQQSLGLKSKDINLLESPLIAAKKAEYQQKLETEQLKKKQDQEKFEHEQKKLEYQRNLQRYEQEFRRAIDSEYPLGDYVIDALRKFKNSLVLKDEDIKRIETSVSQTKEAEYQKQQESERLQQQKSERLRDQQCRRENEQSERKIRQQEEETRTRQTQVVENSKASNTLRYAGFRLRAVAFLVDVLISIILAIMVSVVVLLVYIVGGSTKYSGFMVFTIGGAIIAPVLYHVLYEVSPRKATLGKSLVGIRVTNLYGNKLGFFKSLFRFIFKIAFIACFGIGILHLLVSLLKSKKKQGIHDLMMGTVVVLKDE